MTSATILLIDDDDTLLQLLAEHLQVAGHVPVVATDGPTGLHLAESHRPDLVVLDIMMPGVDGWEVCRRLRAESSVPIILLTAKGEELDKLRGFHLGVDDYVTKPFSFAELVARIQAVLSRASRSFGPLHQLSSGNLTINFDQQRVTIDGQPVDLTRTEYRLLETLAHNPNRTVATEQLIEVVWGPAYAGEVEQVKHFIWALRKKIEIDPGTPKHLITHRGFGYRFE